MLVDAVIALRYGDYSFANAYAAFVKKHRGAEAAKAAQARMKALADAADDPDHGWHNVHEWPAWGYRSKPPPKEVAPPKPKSRKRR